MNTAFYQINKTNTTDVWLTPPAIIEALGEFDLDPCCPNNLPWATAKTFFDFKIVFNIRLKRGGMPGENLC